MDVGNIFKSLFRIYKTTKLLMQHHNSLHTNTHINKKYKANNMHWLFLFFFFFFFFASYSTKTPKFGANFWKKAKTCRFCGLQHINVNSGRSVKPTGRVYFLHQTILYNHVNNGQRIMCISYRAEIQQVTQFLICSQSCHPLLMMHFCKIART